MIDTFAGLSEEVKDLKNWRDVPIPWIRIVSTGLDDEKFHPYNRVQFVYDCNVRPYVEGKLESCMKIWHTAVLFFNDGKLERVFLVEETEVLQRIVEEYSIEQIFRLMGRDDLIGKVSQEIILLDEQPEYARDDLEFNTARVVVAPK